MVDLKSSELLLHPKTINIGLKTFDESLHAQGAGVVHIAWSPPAQGDSAIVKKLMQLDLEEVDDANKEAVSRMLKSQPVLVDINQAKDVILGMSKVMLLHAGPPISWGRMCGPMKGALTGAVLYEGLADTSERATRLLERGEIQLEPCHEHSAVAPMSGVISPSMPVFVVKNLTYGNTSSSNFNEGLGKVLRFGAHDPSVIQRLNWIRDILAPVLKQALKNTDGIDLRAITSKALHMGDECHNRNVAATSVFAKLIAPGLVLLDIDRKSLNEVTTFLDKTDHFFLNLSMAASKAIADAAHGIKNSTIVTAMARNGVDFGIRVSGLGNKWFTARSPSVDGLYFPGYSSVDANPDLGDSSISETVGIGGFAMAASPAIAKFIGGSPSEAMEFTKEMYEITIAENINYTIPTLDFRGAPIGIDIRKVIDTNIAPIIDTGIAHKEAGIGQIGAGITRAPYDCFVAALDAMHQNVVS